MINYTYDATSALSPLVAQIHIYRLWYSRKLLPQCQLSCAPYVASSEDH